MLGLSNRKAYLYLAISAFILSANAQTASCTIDSPQCCWVVRVWQLMGQYTTVSPNNDTECCAMDGVFCTDSTVTSIDWSHQNLTGSLPSDIGMLTSLTNL